MNYPSWDIPIIGGSMVMAFVAVVHVFIAHVAVGGGLFLVLAERKARRDNDPALLEFLKSKSRFFILFVLVFGAVTGAGIWWCIALFSPSATSTLIHTFVWAWAIEWVFFAVEVVAAFIYYYKWDALDPKTHERVGWVYFWGAFLSLVAINGILTFMLTPGDWIENGSLVSAYFNPSMLPSLIVRTGVIIALAGIFVILMATPVKDDDLKARIMRYAGKWVLVGVAFIAPGGLWYIASLPELAQDISMGGAPAIMIFAAMSVAISFAILALTYFGPIKNPHYVNPIVALILVVLGFSAMGVTELVREAVRKPYIIYHYMYANNVRVDDLEEIRETGVMNASNWAGVTYEEDGTFTDRQSGLPADDYRVGWEVFRQQCRNCHAIDGYNGVRVMVKGWEEEFVDHQIERLDQLKGFMPPFAGNEPERKALAKWLARLGSEKPLSDHRFDLQTKGGN